MAQIPRNKCFLVEQILKKFVSKLEFDLGHPTRDVIDGSIFASIIIAPYFLSRSIKFLDRTAF